MRPARRRWSLPWGDSSVSPATPRRRGESIRRRISITASVLRARKPSDRRPRPQRTAVGALRRLRSGSDSTSSRRGGGGEDENVEEEDGDEDEYELDRSFEHALAEVSSLMYGRYDGDDDDDDDGDDGSGRRLGRRRNPPPPVLSTCRLPGGYTATALHYSGGGDDSVVWDSSSCGTRVRRRDRRGGSGGGLPWRGRGGDDASGGGQRPWAWLVDMFEGRDDATLLRVRREAETTRSSAYSFRRRGQRHDQQR